MGKGHGGKGYFLGCSIIHIAREAVGTTNQKPYFFNPGNLFLLKVCSKSYGPHCFSFFIKQNNRFFGGNVVEKTLTFFFLLLSNAKTFPVF